MREVNRVVMGFSPQSEEEIQRMEESGTILPLSDKDDPKKDYRDHIISKLSTLNCASYESEKFFVFTFFDLHYHHYIQQKESVFSEIFSEKQPDVDVLQSIVNDINKTKDYRAIFVPYYTMILLSVIERNGSLRVRPVVSNILWFIVALCIMIAGIIFIVLSVLNWPSRVAPSNGNFFDLPELLPIIMCLLGYIVAVDKFRESLYEGTLYFRFRALLQME